MFSHDVEPTTRTVMVFIHAFVSQKWNTEAAWANAAAKDACP